MESPKKIYYGKLYLISGKYISPDMIETVVAEISRQMNGDRTIGSDLYSATKRQDGRLIYYINLLHANLTVPTRAIDFSGYDSNIITINKPDDSGNKSLSKLEEIARQHGLFVILADETFDRTL